jgi:peroxiredoxin
MGGHSGGCSGSAARVRARRVPAALAFGALSLALAAAARSDAASPPYALIGAAAPDFVLHAVRGGNVRLSEHRGEVVVLSFWSSRCSVCRTQLTALNRSLATYQSAGLAIYGVGVDDEPAKALSFAKSAGVNFALLLDPGKSVSRSYQVDNLPMTVLIDRNGTVRNVLRDYGAASNGLYLQELRALLNE